MLSEDTKKTLFDLAFQYKKRKIWKRLTDQDLFAVQLPDGEIGYCCVMGMEGQHCALSVYVGPSAFSTYLSILRSHSFDPNDQAFMIAGSIGQDCLQCIFEDDDFASEEQIKEARLYAKLLHVRITAPFRFPHFDRFYPIQRPQSVSDEEDAAWLMEVLRAGIFIGDLFQQRQQSRLNLVHFYGPPTEIPLLTPSDSEPGGFAIGSTLLPEYMDPPLPPMPPIDLVTLSKLKKCKKSGVWDCGLVYFINTIIEDKDPNFIPCSPLMYDRETETLVTAYNVGDIEREPETMFRDFVQRVAANGRLPTRIRVHPFDVRCKMFFSAFAEQLRIPLTVSEDLPELNDAILDLSASMATDGGEEEFFEEFSAFVLDMGLEGMRNAPQALQEVSRSLLALDPPTIPNKVKDIIREAQKYWN